MQAKSILENALVVFTEIEQTRPGKFSILGVIVGQLCAKLGSVHATFSKTFESDDHKRVALLHSACEVCASVKVVSLQHLYGITNML